jgi:formiminotetrahydrofolate cyclodeaminase
VAALAGALAAALAGMVAGLTAGRPKFAAVENQMQAAASRARSLRQRLYELMAADAEAFDVVMMAYRQPRGTNDEAAARRDAIQAALREATRLPLEVMKDSLEVLELARLVATEGNASAVSDAGVAGHMAHAALRSAALNVEINVMGLRDLEEGDRLRAAALTLQRRADDLAEHLDRDVRARIAGGP